MADPADFLDEEVHAFGGTVISTYLVDQNKNTTWQRWLTTLLTRHQVTYADKYRPAQPDGPPPTQAPTLRSLLLQSIEGTTPASSAPGSSG